MSDYTIARIAAPFGSIVLTSIDAHLHCVQTDTAPCQSNSGIPEELLEWVDLTEELLNTPRLLTDEECKRILSQRTMSDFQHSVLELTATIPPGHFETYASIARNLGKPGAVRAVGRALATNPFPVLIPCHRVASAQGLSCFNMLDVSTFMPIAYAGRKDFAPIGGWLRLNDLGAA